MWCDFISWADQETNGHGEIIISAMSPISDENLELASSHHRTTAWYPCTSAFLFSLTDLLFHKTSVSCWERWHDDKDCCGDKARVSPNEAKRRRAVVTERPWIKDGGWLCVGDGDPSGAGWVCVEGAAKNSRVSLQTSCGEQRNHLCSLRQENWHGNRKPLSMCTQLNGMCCVSSLCVLFVCFWIELYMCVNAVFSFL